MVGEKFDLTSKKIMTEISIRFKSVWFDLITTPDADRVEHATRSIDTRKFEMFQNTKKTSIYSVPLHFTVPSSVQETRKPLNIPRVRRTTHEPSAVVDHIRFTHKIHFNNREVIQKL